MGPMQAIGTGFRLWAIALALFAIAAGAVRSIDTATSTVTSSKAGDGSGAITGYIVSGAAYALDAGVPMNITQVTFSLDSDPLGKPISLRLNSASSTWYACSNIATAVTCTTSSPQATTGTTNQLEVVIAQ